MDGGQILLKTIPKFARDVIAHARGNVDGVTKFDSSNPIEGCRLEPGSTSPICAKCKLDTRNARNPYFEPFGPDKDPLVTVIMESVSLKEDEDGQLTSGGPSGYLRNVIKQVADSVGVDVGRIRWAPVTRCAAISGKRPNFKTHGNWCRHFLVQELTENPPRVIMPVGSAVLGLLSHKSSAQDWGGRLLTWRGWPDDWVTDPENSLPRLDPADPAGRTIVGHPIFGQRPDRRIPVVPIQSPRIIYATQNPRVISRWKKHIETALICARDGVNSPNYNRPWFKISVDPAEIESELDYLIQHPGTLVCYDTETTGLKPWGIGQKIVFMMFRWVEDGKPKAIGFPWDFEGSELLPYLKRLSPVVLSALYASQIVGHNTTFDMLFSAANVEGCDLDRLCDAAKFDTWHMAYVSRQQTGTLGLDMIAYDWVPDMAGYEEEMTLLIELLKEKLDPAERKGGHYANCPRELWDSHLKTYVMGDVEVCYQAFSKIGKRLDECRTYSIPLAHQRDRGRFRNFPIPSRRWVYDNVVSPASRVLMKMMGRGMYVDVEELEKQEDLFPKRIVECRSNIRSKTPLVDQWCSDMEHASPGWEFDPENKEHLRAVLFDPEGPLRLPVQRLTESGRKLFPEDNLSEVPIDDLLKYAALDKFTLNKLSVDHPEVRPIQNYKKVFKEYTTYVRPMRNLFSAGIDKKARVEFPHLSRDGCVHASFKLTGTRGGRLCVSHKTKLDLIVDGLPVQARICDIPFLAAKQVLIKTHENRYRPLLRAIYKGREETVRVCTDSGAQVEATRGHGLKVPGGWICVGDLSVGDTVSTCLLPRNWNHSGHEKLQGSCSNTKDGVCGNVPGSYSEGCSSLAGVLSERIWSRASKDVLRQTFSRSKIEREVETGPCERPGRRAHKGGSEFVCVNVGSGASAIVSRNFSGSNVGHVGERQQRPIVGLDGAVMFSVGGRKIEPWDCSSSFVFRPPFRNNGGLQSLHEADCFSVGASSCFSRESYEYTLEIRRTGRAVLVSESVRDHGIDRNDGTWDRILQGVPNTWNSVENRLCADRNKCPCGVGRRLPRPSGRHCERFEAEEAWVHGSEVYEQTGTHRPEDSTRGDFEIGVGTVVSVESAGTQEIWDVEVEGDHSYAAQGLIHHNSCVDPNLQQLPRDGIVKRVYASRFKDRGCIYQGDLSQIELRLLAAACGDSAMVDAYLRGVDLHSLTHSNIYAKKYEECTAGYVKWLQDNGRDKEAKAVKEERKVAKTVNFLTGYGGGAFGLQTSLAQQGIYKSVEECEEILEAFFDAYPALRTYLSYYKRFIMENGVAVSILGRVRIFEEIFSDDKEAINKALRAGCNHLIQSTASDIMLVLLCVIESLMRQENMESILVSTVHDSLIIDAVRDELDAVHQISREVMNNIPEVLKLVFGGDYDTSWIIVPLAGDCQVGRNYLDVKELGTDTNPDWEKLLSE